MALFVPGHAVPKPPEPKEGDIHVRFATPPQPTPGEGAVIHNQQETVGCLFQMHDQQMKILTALMISVERLHSEVGELKAKLAVRQ